MFGPLEERSEIGQTEMWWTKQRSPLSQWTDKNMCYRGSFC